MKLILSLIAVFTLFLSGAGQVGAAEGRALSPIFGCQQLTGEWVDDSTVKVESEFLVANGATLVDRTYHFGDGTFTTTNDSSSAPVLHTYLHPGEYIVSVVFRFNVNGQERIVQDSGCRATANNSHLAYTPPSYTCTALAAGRLDHATYRFNMAPAYDQESIRTTYTFDFGDGHILTTSSGSVTHQYTKPGEYFVTAQGFISIPGKTLEIRGGNCTVTVEAAPTDPTADHRP